MDKPTLCLDFDGVLHAYSKGWHDGTIYDGPVPGATTFLRDAVQAFDVCIVSSRSATTEGIEAMRAELSWWLIDELPINEGLLVFQQISFPSSKPPCFVTLDDRAVTFTGEFPSMETLRNFTPWNKKKLAG